MQSAADPTAAITAANWNYRLPPIIAVPQSSDHAYLSDSINPKAVHRVPTVVEPHGGADGAQEREPSRPAQTGCAAHMASQLFET